MIDSLDSRVVASVKSSLVVDLLMDSRVIGSVVGSVVDWLIDSRVIGSGELITLTKTGII